MFVCFFFLVEAAEAVSEKELGLSARFVYGSWIGLGIIDATAFV